MFLKFHISKLSLYLFTLNPFSQTVKRAGNRNQPANQAVILRRQ